MSQRAALGLPDLTQQEMEKLKHVKPTRIRDSISASFTVKDDQGQDQVVHKKVIAAQPFARFIKPFGTYIPQSKYQPSFLPKGRPGWSYGSKVQVVNNGKYSCTGR